ncbi:hypothetical protein LK12_13230 [Novosphingobium malaysiense]|uniref:diguanylate cyclase n=2 Tax=Novosphingobium malaysiense TaxID=1348853 RepID=A0A0B1ZMF5_9SPHN|nr:hypothetical protein LK12_13230 [Novosphingobium malaysiense]
MTVLLGQLIFAPLLVTIRRQIGGFFGHGDTRQYAAEAAILGLVVITTLAVFLQSEVPLLFLSVPPILFATYRFGPIGAALSVFIVAVIGSVATLNGTGPCAAFSTHGISSITFLQIYLVTLLISALPLAAALSARNASYEELMRQKGFFEMASQTAHIGHWRLEIAKERLTWSDEVYRIHGLPIGTPPPLSEAINAYHPDDRGMVSLWLDDCIANGGEFEFDARIVTTGGDVRHVNSRGRADVDGNGEVVALFGVFQDVTQRVHVNQQLDIARMQAEAEARHSRILAETDQLTGVANRRRAMAEFETAVACAQVGGADLVVAVLDVDHFKFVNDTHGHAMGDMVLRQVAEIGAGCLRSTDTFGRIGGEEFLLVLPGANLETAKFVAERIRTRVMEIAVDNPAIPPITTSIGMATYQPGMSVEAIFQAADRALYEAKNSGRNLLKVA